MPTPFNPDRPLNLDLIGYDELDRVPLIGRASDREPLLDLPDPERRPHTAEQKQPAPREFLANDFGVHGL